MSTTTTNYGLIKPDTTDPILIGQLNDNSDAIDAALKENADAIENKPDAADIPSPSTAAPAMNGTASPGTSEEYARADHVHPSDTSKQDALSAAQLAAANSGIDSAKVEQIETNKNNISSIQNWIQYNCLDTTHPQDIDVDNSELTVYHNAFLKRVVISCKIKFLLQRTSASTALLIGSISNIPNYTNIIPLNSVREFVSTSNYDAFIAKNATNYAIAFAVNSGTLAANTEIRAQFEYTYF